MRPPRRLMCAAHMTPPLLLLAVFASPDASAKAPPPTFAPVSLALHATTSWAHADGVSLDVDLVSNDLLVAYRVRLIDVRAPAPLGSLLVYEAGTPAFAVDGGGRWLEPASMLTALIQLPRGFEHLQLTLRLLLESDTGTLLTVDIDLPSQAMMSLPVVSDIPLVPGPPTAAQAAFEAAWSDSGLAAMTDATAKANAYQQLKKAHLGPKAGSPATKAVAP